MFSLFLSFQALNVAMVMCKSLKINLDILYLNPEIRYLHIYEGTSSLNTIIICIIIIIFISVLLLNKKTLKYLLAEFGLWLLYVLSSILTVMT